MIPEINGLNPVTASTRREIITKTSLKCLTSKGSTVVELLTLNPNFVGLNPAATGSRRDNMV
jgi:hypothetical protein